MSSASRVRSRVDMRARRDVDVRRGSKEAMKLGRRVAREVDSVESCPGRRW